MENKQSAVGTQDNSMMKSINQGARSLKGRSDTTTRRLKNRERQRRYRARKRLGLTGATKRPFAVEEPTAVQVELQPNGNHNNFATRVYCGRDWKKDARWAHVAKHQKMNGSIDHSPTPTNLPEVTCLAIGNKSETMLDMGIQPASSCLVNNETPRIVLGGRNWKAEARRKKS